MSNESLLEPVNDAHEAEMAKVAQRCIMAALDHSRAPKIVLVEEGGNTEAAPKIELPPRALRAIADLLGLTFMNLGDAPDDERNLRVEVLG
jgi:hypothetical protein